MRFVPHDYQQEAIDHLLRNDGAALFLRMGGGKTVVTATALTYLLNEHAIDRVLIVAPLRVAEHTWPAEFRKWDHTRHIHPTLIRGTPAQRRKQIREAGPVSIINYENLAWLADAYKANWPFDVVVFDELSKMKSPRAKRWRSMKRALPQIKRVIGLTGTPAANGFLDLWAQVYLLDRGERLGKSMTSYKSRWFTSDYMGFNWTQRPGADKEIQDRIRDICLSIRTTYKDVPVVYNDLPVYLPPAIEENYRELEREMFLELASGGAVEAVSAATLTNKCQQLANGAMYLTDEMGNAGDVYEVVHDQKLEALESVVEEAAGQPVLVAYQYLHDRERILARFPQARHIRTGAEIDDWNARRLPIGLIHPASAGHGLNLQEGGSILVWFGLPWSLEAYEQTVARLARQGQTETVSVHRILAAGTVDATIAKRLESKCTVQEALLQALRERHPTLESSRD